MQSRGVIGRGQPGGGLSLILGGCLQESLYATAVSRGLIPARSRTFLELPRQNITDSRRLDRLAFGEGHGVDGGAGVQRIGDPAVAVGTPQAGARPPRASVGDGVYRRRLARRLA